MSIKKPIKNDVILAIRMPEKLLNQLNALAESKYMGTATMARNVLAQYLIDEAPNALLGATAQPQQPTKTKSVNPTWEAMSPAERKAYDDEWNY